jgi:hypothetical protein
VDKSGKPMVVYHGTDKGGFAAFDRSEIPGHHNGFFFADDPGLAASYTSAQRSAPDPTPPYFSSVRDLLAFAREEDSLFEIEEFVFLRSESKDTYPDEAALRAAWEVDADDEIGKGYALFYDGYRVGQYTDDGERGHSFDAMLEDASSQTSSSIRGVYEVYLRIEDPYEVDAQGENWDHVPEEREDEDGQAFTEYITTNDITRTAEDMGCDGAIIRNVYDPGGKGHGSESGDVYCVFKPEQIKSAYGNRGTFDPTDDDIRKNGRRRSSRRR